MGSYQSRTDVPENEKWNLTDIYSDMKKWEDDFKQIERMSSSLKGYDGSINDGSSLFQYLKLSEELSYKFNHLYAYCMLKVDEDTRDASSQSLMDRAKSLSVKISSSRSFFMPFLLSLDEEILKGYIADEPGLKYFEEDLYDSFRYKSHVLSKEQEAILSQLGEALSVPSATFGMINNADIRFGEVTDENGGKIELTRGMYSKLIEDEDRGIRREAYKAYYKPYVEAKNTIASTLSAAIKNNVTLARIRHYPSALEKGLFGDKVPKEVYENLITSTKKHIAPLHQYSRIRKEKLGLDELRQYDLSVPLVNGVKRVIPYEEAFETMLNALAPLGEDYHSILRVAILMSVKHLASAPVPIIWGFMVSILLFF
jgi:oligoendopeptidase F